MSKPPRNVKYFNMGMWPIYVGITTCEKSFQKEMKRLKLKDVPFLGRTSANATTHFFDESGRATAILITILPFNKKRNSREQYAALIAHEAMHVVQDLQRRLNRGQPLGDEAEAYLIQQIVQECLQWVWRSNKVRSTEPMTE